MTMGVIWYGGPEPQPPSLADKVQWLIQHLWPTGHAPESNHEAATVIMLRTGRVIMLRTGRRISDSCLEKIRTGQDGNPTLSVLTTLASFFRVSLAFFEDKEEDPRLDANRAALYTLAHMNGDSIDLLRALSELRPDERAFADTVIKALAHRTRHEPERAAMISIFTACKRPFASSRSRHVC